MISYVQADYGASQQKQATYERAASVWPESLRRLRGRQREAPMITDKGDRVEFFPKTKRWQGMGEGSDLRNASPSYESLSLWNSQIS